MKICLLLISVFVMLHTAAQDDCASEKVNENNRIFPNPNDSTLSLESKSLFEFYLSFYVSPEDSLITVRTEKFPDGLEAQCGDCRFESGENCLTISGKTDETGKFHPVITFESAASGRKSDVYIFDMDVATPSYVEEQGNDHLIFSSYPNPVRGIPTFAFHSSKARSGNIKVFDQTGQLIDEFSVSLNRGITRFNYRAQELTSGIYHVILDVEDEIRNLKMILLN